jgi:hypothetical protein
MGQKKKKKKKKPMGEYLYIPKHIFFVFLSPLVFCTFFLKKLVFFTIILFVKRIGVLYEYKK